MPSVYIETTIPSFYHETRRDPTIVAWRSATRRWWHKYRVLYDLYTSGFVYAELDLGPPAKRRRGIALLRQAQSLDEPPGLEDVIAFYIQHHLMPDDAKGDAAHLAMASMHHMNFLLTWNCRHLANANKVRHLTVLNARLGLPVPVVTTPYSLIPETAT